MVRQGPLKPPYEGPIPSSPADEIKRIPSGYPFYFICLQWKGSDERGSARFAVALARRGKKVFPVWGDLALGED